MYHSVVTAPVNFKSIYSMAADDMTVKEFVTKYCDFLFKFDRYSGEYFATKFIRLHQLEIFKMKATKDFLEDLAFYKFLRPDDVEAALTWVLLPHNRARMEYVLTHVKRCVMEPDLHLFCTLIELHDAPLGRKMKERLAALQQFKNCQSPPK